MPLEALLIIIVVIAFMGYFFFQEEKKRRQRLADWAKRNNWHYDSGTRKGWEKEYPAVKLFDEGHSRHGKNVITGHFKSMPITCFDYQYTVGHGKNQQTHRRAVTILGVDHPMIPLFIRRENPFDRVGEFLGADDIDFESAEFSRTFFVKSPDKKWAYDVIHSRTMEYLLKAPKQFTVAFGASEIVIIKTGRSEPDQYEKAVVLARELYDLIPEFVLQQMKGK